MSILCNLFCLQHITYSQCFLPAVYLYLGLICPTLANLCCLMSSAMASESIRLLFGPGDASRAYSCISFCFRLSSLPKSLLWPQSLDSLPRLATQSAFRLFFIIICVLCWTVRRCDGIGLGINMLNHVVLEPELEQLQDEWSCPQPETAFLSAFFIMNGLRSGRRV